MSAGQRAPVVKVCGICRPVDAELAIELGAQWIGCVFAPDSPRRISRRDARRVLEVCRGRVPVVAVFRKETTSTARILWVCRQLGLEHVQVVGANGRSLTRLRRIGLTPLPVHSVEAEDQVLPALMGADSAPAVLDTGRGGTGRQFPWHLLAPQAPRQTLIAGGIRPHNVADLLRYRPYGLDVSSGIESAPGVKDPELMHALFRRIRSEADVSSSRETAV